MYSDEHSCLLPAFLKPGSSQRSCFSVALPFYSKRYTHTWCVGKYICNMSRGECVGCVRSLAEKPHSYNYVLHT